MSGFRDLLHWMNERRIRPWLLTWYVMRPYISDSVNVFLRCMRVSSRLWNESSSRLCDSSITWWTMIQSSISLWERMNWSGQTFLDSGREGTGDLWQFDWLCDFTQTVKHDLLRWTTNTVKEQQKCRKTETIVISGSTEKRTEDCKNMVEWISIDSRMRSRDQAILQCELYLVNEDWHWWTLKRESYDHFKEFERR
jgi:hypothetical protein